MKDFTQKLQNETVEKLNLNCQDVNDSWSNLADIVNDAVYNKMSQIEVLDYDYTKNVEEKEYVREAIEEVLNEYEVCEEDIETLVDFILDDTDLVERDVEGRIEEIVEFLLGEYLETVSDEDLSNPETAIEGLEEWLGNYFGWVSQDLYEELISTYFEDKIEELIEWEREQRA